jgi:hypothetical protein
LAYWAQRRVRKLPTIPQLPVATSTGSADELPVSQAGITRSVSVAELLGGVQPAITLPPSTLLGRVSLGPGGPEPVAVGIGLTVEGANIVATAVDHTTLPSVSAIAPSDDIIINAAGAPAQAPASAIIGLLTPGANIVISQTGTIAASTAASVLTELSDLTSGLATTNTNVAALAAKIPTGGYVSLNSQGQVTAPIAGAVDLGTVTVASGVPARTLDSKALDVLNVLDFGATTNGADCTAAFNATFNALSGNGGEIFVPSGDYQLLSPLTWNSKPFTLRGAGKGLTRLHVKHNGVAISVTQTSPFNKVNLRDLSVFAENATGATAAVAVLNYPSEASFGYVSAFITDIECFGYPNAANGIAPFPQTFNRGFVLNNCWNVQVNNVSWFGPPAAAGATTAAVIEVNGSVDTRISGLQAYYGNAAVIQTGYCEGIYFDNPILVGLDYMFTQSNITTWPGYTPTKNVLLGLWAANGEININLGIVQATNADGAYFVGMDFSRNGGPNISQTLFQLTNVSNYLIVGCGFNGGPSGGSNQDVAFGFTSTYNSSGNTVSACNFQNMATVFKINGVNGTVGLTTNAIDIGNIPIATAVIDNSSVASSNLVTFLAPATSTSPVGFANTKDHLLTASDGSALFRVSAVPQAANHVHLQAATAGNPPVVLFEGTDATINATVQTKGGNFYFSAAGGSSGSGNLVNLLNVAGSTAWVQIQNATSGNLCEINTNQGGLGLQPRGALWLSPANGLFIPSLPTSKPTAGSGQIWNNAGVLSIA